MKKNIIFLIILLSVDLAVGQDSELKLADQYFTSARALMDSSKYKKAIETGKKALKAYKKIYGEKDTTIIKTYSLVAGALMENWETDSALLYVQKGITIVKDLQLENSFLASSCYTELGHIYQQQRNYQKAKKEYEKALDIRIATTGTWSPYTAGSYSDLGNVFVSLANYKQAIKFFEKTIDIKLKITGDENLTIAHAYTNIGNAFKAQGNHTKAIRFHEKALTSYLKVLGEKNTSTEIAYNNLGNAFWSQGNYQKAIYFQKKALDIALHIYGDKHLTTSFTYNNLGVTMAKMENYTEAVQYFEKALKIRLERLGENHPSTAVLYYNLSGIYTSQKDYKKSIELVEKTLQIILGYFNKNHPKINECYNLLGNLFSQEGNYKRAFQFYNKAFSNLQYSVDKPYDFSNVSELLLLQSLLKNRIHTYQKQAIKKNKIPPDSLGQFYNHLLSLQNHICQKLPEQAYGKNQIKESFSIFENAIQHFLTDFHKAFEISEKSKARQLAANFRQIDMQQLAIIPDRLLEKEYDLNIDIAYYDKKRFQEEFEAEHPNDSLINLYKNHLFELHQQRDALVLTFKEQYPDYHQVKYNHEVSSVEQIQNNLQEDQALIEYFVGDSTVFVFVITSEQYQVKAIPKDFPLKEWVQQMRDNIYSFWMKPGQAHEVYQQNKTKYTKYARLLYEQLVAPIQNLLPEKLIIIPDGVLHFIPFDALLYKDIAADSQFRQYPFWLKKHQIAYNYSATLRHYLQQRKRSKTALGFLAFAPQFEGQPAPNRSLQGLRGELHQLKYNVPETKAIQTLLGGQVITGASATKANFLKSASNASILHLATHGKSNDQLGDYSFVAFTEIPDSTLDNDRLYVRELYNLQLHADLVVLSACESGLGELQRGEGMISLSRGFTYAGTASTITSLWSVNDAKTSDLMRQFYEQLQQGLSKDEALRAAKLSFLEEESPADPYFWAAFVPFGNMTPVALNSGFGYWWFILWGLGIILLGTVLWRFLKAQKQC